MIPRFCPELTPDQIKDFLEKPYQPGTLEEKFMKLTGAQGVLTLSSGREALFQALRLAGIGVGDEVIIPSLNCTAVAEAVLATKATPVLADVKEEDYTLDPRELERLYTPQTRAVIAVHFNGIPCAMEEILAWCHQKKVILLEDAAQALGVRYQNRLVGTMGDFGIYSFAFDKHLTSGGGGLLVVNQANYLEALEETRQKVLLPNKVQEDKIISHLKRKIWFYQPEHYGWGRKVLRVSQKLWPERELSLDLNQVHGLGHRQSALILGELEHIEEWNANRLERITWFIESIQEEGLNQSLKLPQMPSFSDSVPLRYTVQIKKDLRNKVAEALLREGIEPGPFIYSAPLHLKDEVAKYAKMQPEALKRSADLTQSLLNLPIHSKVSKSVIRHIVGVISRGLQA